MPKKFAVNSIVPKSGPHAKKSDKSKVYTILPHSYGFTNNIGNEVGNAPKCRECGDATTLNVVRNPRGVRWLRCGICDLALRRCPDPDHLSQSPNLTREEREYCSKVASLDWFGGQVAGVLLSLEAKAGGSDHV